MADSDKDSFSGSANNLLFSGRLELPSAQLKFYDPDESICMTVPIESESVEVTIYADDVDEASELLVKVVPHIGS
jgi:hypothetical protein